MLQGKNMVGLTKLRIDKDDEYAHYWLWCSSIILLMSDILSIPNIYHMDIWYAIIIGFTAEVSH